MQVEQRFPNRTIADIPGHIRQELAQADFSQRLKPGARLALGVGSRGLSHQHVLKAPNDTKMGPQSIAAGLDLSLHSRSPALMALAASLPAILAVIPRVVV